RRHANSGGEAGRGIATGTGGAMSGSIYYQSRILRPGSPDGSARGGKQISVRASGERSKPRKLHRSCGSNRVMVFARAKLAFTSHRAISERPILCSDGEGFRDPAFFGNKDGPRCAAD